VVTQVYLQLHGHNEGASLLALEQVRYTTTGMDQSKWYRDALVVGGTLEYTGKEKRTRPFQLCRD
jgi:hypothetical protein